jgi:hypothetical protein
LWLEGCKGEALKREGKRKRGEKGGGREEKDSRREKQDRPSSSMQETKEISSPFTTTQDSCSLSHKNLERWSSLPNTDTMASPSPMGTILSPPRKSDT